MTDIDTGGAEGANKALNRMVAITVVMLAVFLGICHIKDDNICQSMAQAKADSIDTWNEYQATKIKLHVSQDTLATLDAVSAKEPGIAAERVALKGDIVKYTAEAPGLQDKAKGFDAKYNQLNFHDDQFDAADALVGIAISAAAVASLAETGWVLWAAWVFGALGAVMGVSGFAGWSLHPDFLANFLS